MKSKKIAYTEEIVDRNGVKRVYGYTLDGEKYFLNLLEVIEKYEKLGIRSFGRCA